MVIKFSQCTEELNLVTKAVTCIEYRSVGEEFFCYFIVAVTCIEYCSVEYALFVAILFSFAWILV